MKARTAPSLSFEKYVLRISVACLIACLLLIGAKPLGAQALQGITGSVTDASGATVAGADITATNDATGVVSKTTTTSAGTYEFNGLIPGSYTVKVEFKGFTTSVHNGVRGGSV